MNEKPIRKAKVAEKDTMRAEYRRDDLGQGVRGKHFEAHTRGTNLVLLRPEVAKVFPTQAAVNEALLGLMRVAQRAAQP